MNNKTTSKTKELLKVIYFTVAFAILMITAMFGSRTAKAEVSISVKEINYYDSTITIQVNDKDTAIYYSDSAKKVWTKIPGQISSGMISMDISWVLASKNYVMTFKGDYSTSIISVTIPKQETRFKVSFNKLKGTVVFSNTQNRTIEWRKKDSSTWHTLNMDTLAADLSYYFTNGAQLCYRLAPVNGTGITNPGLRASNEVTVSIPQKTAAPAVTINGSKFSIPVKKGMAYRKLFGNGTISEWINVNYNTELLLRDIAPETLYQTEAALRKEVRLQFRTNASSTSQVSNITTLTIPVQKAAPDTAACGITYQYTSSSALALTVKAASSSSPFEYTILPRNRELSYQTANWKTISSGSPVSISSSLAPEGSHIYVRRKSIEATDTISFSMASVETDITGVNGIEYPDAPFATQLTTLVTTAGVCRSDSSLSYLTFYLFSPTPTTVSAITFYDSYGINKGTVTSKSTVAKNSNSTGVNDRYIITTRITSTDTVDAFTLVELYAYITFDNQEVIKSTSTAGVVLYLYPETVVNNSEKPEYTTDFKRIYLSNDTRDASSFQFRLDFGTEKVIDPSGINKFTAETIAINTLNYNGYTLIKDIDYSVEYGSYINEEDITVATATVTVNAANMEKSAYIKNTGTALPLLIYLNNGEILKDDIKVTMIATAVIDDTPIACSIMEGSLKEKDSNTVTNPDGTTTTTTQEEITYTISLTLFSASYDVSVSNVTWGGISIFGSATVSKGKAVICLSNTKINKLVTNSTDTKNIVITLSNGYVIDSGYKLTIINAD